MDELIKLLDENLEYVSRELIDDTINIYVISNRKEATCPFCGQVSTKVHSHYMRSFQDFPIQGEKVKNILNNRKMFCSNPMCEHKTFAETFDFLPNKAKETKRLEDEIINISLNISSITASNILHKNVANVGKSTVCNIFKKRNSNSR